MSQTMLLARLGFDLPKLAYSYRTALAACVALLVAWLIGLEHPQWSAMTVWAASQPTRGQLLEKSAFRVAGTAVGTIVGILLVGVAGEPVILVIGLAAWIALCAGIGNLQRGYVSYGTILAGYSASMVALLDTGHPDRILDLGADRFATVLVGVLVALVVGLVFTPHSAEEELTGRLRRLTAKVLRDLANGIGQRDRATISAGQHDILAEIAAIEGQLEPHGAGSRRSRLLVHTVRSLLMAETSLLLLAPRHETTADAGELTAHLHAAADSIEAGASPADIRATMQPMRAHAAAIPALVQPLETVARGLIQILDTTRTAQAPVTVHFGGLVVLHQDWDGAWRAAARAGIVMLAVGLIWALTGWSVVAFLLLGVSIMTSLFSTLDNPSTTMRVVFIGQVFGGAAALVCRYVLWPFAPNELAMVLLMMPVILTAPLLFSHRRTPAVALEFAMVSLLLLNPIFPASQSFFQSLASAVAVTLAPLIALVAYRLIFPVDAHNRLQLLVGAMVREVEALARSTKDLSSHGRVWQARLYHRLLRLVRLAGVSGSDGKFAIDVGLAMLSVGTATLVTRDLQRQVALPSAVGRALTVVLGRVGQLRQSPERAAAALASAANRLSRLGRLEAETLDSASRAITANTIVLRSVRS